MNIYIRTQDNDLMKYLSDQQAVALLAKCEKQQLKPGEYVYSDKHAPDCFIMVLEGELELKKPDGTAIGNVFAGEVEGEISFIEPMATPYYLQAVKASAILKLSYASMRDFIKADPDHAARIHAAINDSICLKIIRLTHRRSHG
jgi:CRP-like cAMP-binding protein